MNRANAFLRLAAAARARRLAEAQVPPEPSRPPPSALELARAEADRLGEELDRLEATPDDQWSPELEAKRQDLFDRLFAAQRRVKDLEIEAQLGPEDDPSP